MLLLTALMAAAVLSQAPVDESYRPRPGDRAQLGTFLRGDEAKGRPDAVYRADGYATLGQLRRAVESRLSDPAAVRGEPDCICPRVGTAALVIDGHRFEAVSNGDRSPRRAFKVRILEGDFKDRVVFVEVDDVIRLVGDPAAPAATPRRRAPVRPAGDIVLTDLAVEPNRVTKFASISGRFRNTSGRPLKAVMVGVVVEDARGKMIHSATAFSTPATIEPGAIGTFQTIVEDDPAAAGVKLDFKDYERAIPWVDESGKDVHQ